MHLFEYVVTCSTLNLSTQVHWYVHYTVHALHLWAYLHVHDCHMKAGFVYLPAKRAEIQLLQANDEALYMHIILLCQIV